MGMAAAVIGSAVIGGVGANVAANKASNAAKSSANAAGEAAQAQIQAGQQASTLLDPFQQIGQQGLDQANFLTDPQAQFDFLQNNPLFQMGLDNANTQTNQMAAARGRLSAGDTLQQLNQNALLTAAPLIADQKNSISGLLNLGVNVAGTQGGLRTGQGAAQAGGIIGSQNALNQGVQADINNIGAIAGLGGSLLQNYPYGGGGGGSANIGSTIGGYTGDSFNTWLGNQ
jgi:hypothetical protein